MGKRAVFLDRDGVINEAIVREGKPYPPSGIREVILLPDAGAALARLKQDGFLLLVVTNQPDVRRGTSNQADVEEIHRFLSGKLPIDDFFVCYHDDRDHCDCRKPLPGLLLQAAEQYDIDLTASYLIGDRWRDIDAGNAAGCRTILIDYGYRERASTSPPEARVTSLSGAVDWILQHKVLSH